MENSKKNLMRLAEDMMESIAADRKKKEKRRERDRVREKEKNKRPSKQSKEYPAEVFDDNSSSFSEFFKEMEVEKPD